MILEYRAEHSPGNQHLILFHILQVRRGEEIFILFEINEWAFVTVFTNTSRRGYVPLDYCDVVKDFYELNPQFHPR